MIAHTRKFEEGKCFIYSKEKWKTPNVSYNYNHYVNDNTTEFKYVFMNEINDKFSQTRRHIDQT